MDELVDALEQIVYGGVGITTAALLRSAGADLTLTQWRAVVTIGQHSDGLRISELARSVHVTVPATSRLLRRLERRGFVELRTDETDGRATRARLTEAGEELRSAVLSDRRKQLESIAADVKLPRSAYRIVRDLANGFQRQSG